MCIARALGSIALVAVLAQSAAADTDAEFKLADSLFDEGRTLLEEGKISEACEKFTESFAKNPNAIGTIINLAQCKARLGKIASAVAMFSDARAHAHEARAEQYIALADEKIAELSPLVPYLRLDFAERTADVTMTLDGKPIPVPKPNAELPVDPGPHDVVVTRPEHRPFHAYVTVTQKEHKTVPIPALEGVGGFPIGAVVAGGGGVLFLGGIVIGLVARSQYNNELAGDCGTNVNECTPGGVKATNTARKVGDVGTGIGIAGLVTAGVGGYLWWAARHREHAEERATGVAVRPVLAPAADGNGMFAGVAAAGRF